MSKFIITEEQYKKLNEAGLVPTPVGQSNSQMNVPTRSSQTGGNGQVDQAQANNLTISNNVRQIYSLLKKEGATVKLYASGYVIQSSDLSNPENVYLTYNNKLFSIYIRYTQIGKEKAQNYINLIAKQFPNYQLDGQQKDNGQQLLATFIPRTNREGGSVVTESKLDSIEKSVGELCVRNLIKEGNEIHGEIKSSYGIWSKMKWNEDGSAKDIENKFKQITHKLPLI